MEVLRNLLRRRLRASLTIFGIAVGVFAFVVMGGMAEKMNRMTAGATQYLTDRILISEKGSSLFSGGMIALAPLGDLTKVEGVGAVETVVQLLFDESPSLTLWLPDLIEGISVADEARVEAVGNPGLSLHFTQGGWWREGERGKAVLGADLAQRLHKRVGDTVRARGYTFKVVGLLARTLTAPDQMMFVPLEDARAALAAAHPLLRQVDLGQMASQVAAIVKRGYDPSEVAARLAARLPNYQVTSPVESRRQLAGATAVFNLIVMGSGLVAVLVGGLAVVNTMIMAVSERTREIGIKKALGADERDSLREYLLESGLMGVIGGLGGLLLGWALIEIVNRFTAASGTTIFLLTPRLAWGALLFAAGLGLGAGYLPARHAARLDPVKALRYE